MKNFFWLCVGLVAGYKAHEWVNSETGKSAEASSSDMLNEVEEEVRNERMTVGHLFCQAIG